ncbi:post-segregation killing protein [Escherichia coli]|nr:post-segregation killing protein [Escherichia coli]
MLQQHQDSLLPRVTQGEKAMKQPKNALTWCLLIVCCTLLIFTYLTRNRLCEVRLKDGNREVTASLAYESNGK